MEHVDVGGRPEGSSDPLHTVSFVESWSAIDQIWVEIEQSIGIAITGRVSQPYLIHMVGDSEQFFRLASRWWRNHDDHPPY
jgi:hypothetical protein